jgi:hypothetical protein
MMRLAAADMADALTSGLSGPALAQVLREHFPAISREEAFWACALAASITNADILMLQMQVADARRQLMGEAVP